TAFRLFEHGFLGPLVLREGAGAGGIAAALAAYAVEALRRSGVVAVEAEASRDDALVLAGLGFAPVRETLVLERAPSPRAAAGASVPLEAHHLLDVGALDAGAVGHGRKEYLWSLREDFPEGARASCARATSRGTRSCGARGAASTWGRS
ncbi:MAG TPA: hypothetical protein VHH36_02855, partial [Candidatus Thermoplasmatota archaeon]|nr:hypothetical protein [Candidatus Thermoplasmatota archaeon]